MNIFSQLYYSLFSAKHMAQFRKQGLGKTIGFIILLSALSLIPIYFVTNEVFVELTENSLPELQEKLPKFQVNNGVLTVEEASNDRVTNDYFTIIFSPNETSPSGYENDTGYTLEMLKDSVVVSYDNAQQVLDYKSFLADSFTDQDLKDVTSLLTENANFIYGVFIGLSFIYAVIFKLVVVTLISIFAYFVSRQLGALSTFKQNWIMSVYSIVIPTIFLIITNSLHIYIPYEGLILWVSSLIVVYQTIKEVPKGIQ